MRRIVAGARPSSSRGNARESTSHALRLTEKARKIATPPSRGSGARWTCRSPCGTETQPRRVARSRTERVATNDTASENANNAKNRSVKIQSSLPAETPACPASPLQGRFSQLFQTGCFLLVALEPFNFEFLELYIEWPPRATVLAQFVVNS